MRVPTHISDIINFRISFKSHAVRHQPVTIAGHWNRGRSCQHQHSSSQQLLGFLIPVPGLFWHQHFLRFNVRCRTIRSSGIQNCTKEEKETPCTSKQLAVLRHTPSTFTLLAKERDTPCIPTHTAGDGNGYTLHIHRAGSGKATPCKSILLMLRWFKEIHLQIHTAGDGKRYIREAHTVGSAKRYILLLLHVHTACVAKINHAHPYCLLLTAYCYGSGAMLHPPEMNCTPLSYPAPLENDCTLLSYASPP